MDNKKITFNKQVSPFTENTSLKFTADNKVKITFPNFGDNNEDVSCQGTWALIKGFVKIKWKMEFKRKNTLKKDR